MSQKESQMLSRSQRRKARALKPMPFEIVDEHFIKICGVKYSMGLFQAMGFAPVGTIIEIVNREDDFITIKLLQSSDQGASLKALEEELEQARSVIRQASLDTFGEELTIKEFADRSSYDS